MATQKEKIMKATQMAMRIKSMASRLRYDASRMPMIWREWQMNF